MSDLDTTTFVGPDIVVDSPLARAALRKRADDEFSVELPTGRATFVVVSVSYE